jgi:chromosome segregation ATPase
MKVVDGQLAQIASSLSEQKAYLATQIDAMASSLEVDKADIGIVSRSHHEGELDKLKKTNEEIEKITKEKQQQIDLKEEEIKRLKAQMATMSLDVAKFCASCPFNVGGLRTSCGKRFDYLVDHHSVKEEDAKVAVMKADPNCSSK